VTIFFATIAIMTAAIVVLVARNNRRRS